MTETQQRRKTGMRTPALFDTIFPLSGTTKKILTHLALALAAFICAGLFILMVLDVVVMPRLLRTGSAITAPDMLGMPIEDVQLTIKKLGLRLESDSSAYDSRYPVNTVSFQYPYPGSKIKIGRSVRVRVSLGSRPVEMPGVVGRSQRDAELTIKRYGLAIARIEWVHSNEYVRGMIARQHPAQGSEIPMDAKVVLYVSDGLPETNAVMPRLIELGLSAAMDTLRAYNFNTNNVRIQKEEAPHLLPETIIDQHPDPGAATNSNVEITLIVSDIK